MTTPHTHNPVDVNVDVGSRVNLHQPELNTVLAQLKDIHYPPQIPGFQITPIGLAVGAGLLLLLLLLCILSARSVYFRLKPKIQRMQIKKTILQKLDTVETPQELSILMRQCVEYRYPHHHHQPVRLCGVPYLLFLDQTSDTQGFTEGPGQSLITAPYQKNPVIEFKSMVKLCRHWIQKNL
jgi:hypothetical protein